MSHLEHALPTLGAEHCARSTAVPEGLGFIMKNALLHVGACAGLTHPMFSCAHIVHVALVWMLICSNFPLRAVKLLKKLSFG